ncbi:cytochrome P450 81Q32-like [Rutidosis leptorrhynchoides]|uniref:cytochrome P450 81Q32-like n=1 Tax=Rutidosis leptorrhynchoides TaxID=125765 RepID=UPI003A9A6672
MEILYLYMSLIFVVLSYLFTSHFGRKFSNLPPTIFPSLPVIGHLYLLKPPLHQTLAKLSIKHGPILNLQLGSRHLLLISSPSASQECFTKNDVIFTNRPHTLYGKIIGNNNTSLNWAPYGDNWRNLRRIASTALFSMHSRKEFHDILVDEEKLLIRKIQNASVSSVHSHVNVKAVLNELMLNIMMRIISGNRYFVGDIGAADEEGKQFSEILEETFLLGMIPYLGDFLPFLRNFVQNGYKNKLISLKNKRDIFFQGFIEQFRKSEGVVKNKKTMIQLLLSLQESDPNYYTDEMIRSFMLILLSAGSDTTTGTMEWCLSLLLNHPHVLQKSRNEIDRVIGKDRLVEESDLVDLPYLRCIINETLRLYPPGPLLVPRESSKDCVIGDYNVPRGTMLIVNQWSIQRDPKLWNDPESFNPERFEGLEGTRDGFKFMPFGFGRRSCPGEGLALHVIEATLGVLIQCFDWERLNGKMVDMTESLNFNLVKVEPLVAKCKPRAEMKNLLDQM